jgi:hypothetical protein
VFLEELTPMIADLESAFLALTGAPEATGHPDAAGPTGSAGGRA